ncbi:MAG: hypothetical protein K2X57_11620 [Xanthobacteraceae bacterium]|nr:hypothetical protein [Xanthobacteraceae bacterium]
MSPVVQLRTPPNLKVRPRTFNPRVAIVSLFEEDDELIGLAKQLYQDFGLFTVADWDRRGQRLLDGVPVSKRTRRKFLEVIGTASEFDRGQARILAFRRREL